MRKYTECFGAPGEKIAQLATSARQSAETGAKYAAQKASEGYDQFSRFFSGRPKESLASQRRGPDTTNELHPEKQKLVSEIRAELDRMSSNVKNPPSNQLIALTYLNRAVIAQRIFHQCTEVLKGNIALPELIKASDDKETRTALLEYQCNQTYSRNFVEKMQSRFFSSPQSATPTKTGMDLVNETIQLSRKLGSEMHNTATARI